MNDLVKNATLGLAPSLTATQKCNISVKTGRNFGKLGFVGNANLWYYGLIFKFPFL